MAEAVIRVEMLSSAYEERLILKDVSLQVHPGEVLVIIGTSGCGKTTLLKHLIGLLQARSGRIEVLGNNLAEIGEQDFVRLRRRLGVLFQNGALLNSISVAENVSIPLEQHTSLAADLIADMVQLKLQLVGLEHAINLLPSELSGGMRKRAALARALALDPEILFADEPGAGLDPVTLAELDQLLLSLRSKLGMTLVIVTHEVNSIRRIADRIVYLHEGEVLFSGSLQDALQSELPQLKHFFYSVP